MAKAKYLGNHELKAIYSVYEQHPNWSYRQITNEVRKIIGEPDNSTWPSENTVGLKIREYLKRGIDFTSPLDEPWSLITVIKYPIPPDAIQPVLDAFIYYQESISSTTLDDRPFSIRQALWVARLYRLISNIEDLTLTAVEYSVTERMSEILELDITSVMQDIHLIRNIRGGLADANRVIRNSYSNRHGTPLLDQKLLNFIFQNEIPDRVSKQEIRNAAESFRRLAQYQGGSVVVNIKEKLKNREKEK